MEFMILDAIQTLRTPWLDGFMVFVSSLGNKGAVWIALAVVLLAFPKYRRLGAVVACALVLDLVACNLVLKPLVARPRPCDINTALDYLIARPHGWSFPSGHTAASFAAASALWFGKSRLWIPCGIFGCADCVSRLYLYVHFPTDVLGGAVVGILCGALGALRYAGGRHSGTKGKRKAGFGENAQKESAEKTRFFVFFPVFYAKIIAKANQRNIIKNCAYLWTRGSSG